MKLIFSRMGCLYYGIVQCIKCKSKVCTIGRISNDLITCHLRSPFYVAIYYLCFRRLYDLNCAVCRWSDRQCSRASHENSKCWQRRNRKLLDALFDFWSSASRLKIISLCYMIIMSNYDWSSKFCHLVQFVLGVWVR